MSTRKAATSNGFLIFTDQLALFKNIPDEAVGAAIKLLLENFGTMETINAEPFTNMAYEIIATTIRRYRKEQEIATKNGKKGGNPTLNPTLKGTLNPTLKQQDKTRQDITRQEITKDDNNVFFIEKKTKKTDPFTNNPIIDKFYAENKRIFGKKLYLTAQQRQRVMELNTEIEDFPNTITTAFEKLKTLDFDLPNFNPNAAWLLRDDNYTNVLNGLYEGKKKQDIWEELREKERIRNGTT